MALWHYSKLYAKNFGVSWGESIFLDFDFWVFGQDAITLFREDGQDLDWLHQRMCMNVCGTQMDKQRVGEE